MPEARGKTLPDRVPNSEKEKAGMNLKEYGRNLCN